MKKVLVIGGSGFLGAELLRQLAKGRYEVFALEHATPLPNDILLNRVRGSIRALSPGFIKELGPDIIFHFGRPKFPKLGKAGRMLAARYASLLNRELVHSIEKSGSGASLIFASGSLMYGPSEQPQLEDTPLHPSSFAKQYFPGEKPIIDALDSGRLQVNVVRFPWVLGHGSWFKWFYLVPMKQHKAVPVFGDGKNRMEIIDIRDSVELAIRFAAGSGSSGILNMVSSGPVAQLEFATILSQISGLPLRDYSEVFNYRPEKAAIEAFNSTIILGTKHPEVFKDYRYIPLEDSIKHLMQDVGLDQPRRNT